MLRKLIGGLATALLFSTGASAGTIALEGSDATALHEDATYVTQLFGYLKSDSTFNTKPVLVICDDAGGACVSSAPAGTVQIGITAFSALSQADLNANYSAVYISSPDTCCDERNLSAANQTKIKNFSDLGGSFAIQDYQGGNATLLGFDAPSTEIAGHGGGLGGDSCWDSQIFLPSALAKGFTQPPVLGCWAHQAYDMDYFGTGPGGQGFVSLVDSGRSFDSLGSGVFSSFLVKGGELGTVPVPATVLLAGLGLLGVLASRRRA